MVIAPDQPEPAMPIGAAARFVRDAREGEGPLAGLSRGLEAVSGELAIAAGGDMPDLSTAVLREMLRRHRRGCPSTPSRCRTGIGSVPFPAWSGSAPARDAAHALLRAGERSLRSLLNALRVAVIDEPAWTALDPGRRTLFDVDEPGDIEGDV